MGLSAQFRPLDFDRLPGWREDDHSGAYDAFRRSAHQVLVKPYKTGALGVEIDAFSAAYAEARLAASVTPGQARTFFERHFRPALVSPDNGSAGLVTGFYEPEAEASPMRTERFRYPLLARPTDLVDVDDSNRPAGMDPYLAFARATPGGLVEYHDRAAIERGALGGQGLEFAWLADPVDVFFIHVQGAARLSMTDGTMRRVTYAAK